MKHVKRTTRFAPPQQRGLTLVEVTVSTLLVGLLAIGAMTTVGAVARTRSVISDRLMAHDLAQHLMTEILQVAYVDPQDADFPPGPDFGETPVPRSNFDDVDDFHGWDATPPVNQDGVALSAYGGWRREAFVDWVIPGSLTTSGSDTGLKRIRVRVTAPSGTQLELVSMRTATGAGEQLPMRDATVVTWVEAHLRLGPATPTTLGGSNQVNQASDK